MRSCTTSLLWHLFICLFVKTTHCLPDNWNIDTQHGELAASESSLLGIGIAVESPSIALGTTLNGINNDGANAFSPEITTAAAEDISSSDCGPPIPSDFPASRKQDVITTYAQQIVSSSRMGKQEGARFPRLLPAGSKAREGEIAAAAAATETVSHERQSPASQGLMTHYAIFSYRKRSDRGRMRTFARTLTITYQSVLEKSMHIYLPFPFLVIQSLIHATSVRLVFFLKLFFFSLIRVAVEILMQRC